MSELFRYTNFPDEPAEFESRDDELAQLRARIDALENDIICAFCGSHYKADDVPPQHYQTCGQSPLVQRIAEQARQLDEARNLIDQSETDAMAISNMTDGYESEMAEHLANQLGRWLAANPAPQEGE